uniref:Maturase K n=2 Tax=Panagrolaimus sp. PS1159 TaxID=55785 RepID=A0AC35FWR2_9BILA
MITFNNDGMFRQRFAFKAPVMDYILQNLKPIHLIKLYQCCKYFYAKFRRNIIRHLDIVPLGQPEALDPTNCAISAWNPALSTFKDCWITDSLTNKAGIFFLPQFSHCYIKKLESLNGIRWSGYKKLAKAETIEELNIAECLYFPVEYGYDMYAPVENIIAEVPNAKSIVISNAHFTEESCEALLSINRNVKFSKFILRNITPRRLFKFELFKEFILKNAEPECNVRIDYELFDEDDVGACELNEYLLQLGECYSEIIKLDLEMKNNLENML